MLLSFQTIVLIRLIQQLLFCQCPSHLLYRWPSKLHHKLFICFLQCYAPMHNLSFPKYKHWQLLFLHINQPFGFACYPVHHTVFMASCTQVRHCNCCSELVLDQKNCSSLTTMHMCQSVQHFGSYPQGYYYLIVQVQTLHSYKIRSSLHLSYLKVLVVEPEFLALLLHA